MDRYPDISDHGLIGDLQTAALVATDGTVDWFCTPRFDSPSVFASLLDADKGGYMSVAPATDKYVSRQLYFPDTAMLITRFLTADGVGEVTDFMPIAGQQATDRHRLVRQLKVVRGAMNFVAEVKPRFDYGRAPHTLEITSDGFVFHCAGGQHLTLCPTGEREVIPGGQDGGLAVQRIGDDLRMTVALREGETSGVVLETMGGRPRRIPPAELRQMVDDTSRFWRDWVHRSTYRGRWREMVARSAMSLKLMTYAPTGALVAAPTAGLPEMIGGERNWDYRYTWIRDASFSVYALLGLGYTGEAAAFGQWIRDRVVEHGGNGTSPLKIMYRVDGSSGAAAGLPGLDRHREPDRLGLRALGPARRGHLGNPRRPRELHLRPGSVLGRPGPGNPDRREPRPPRRDRPLADRPRRHLYPGHDPRLEPGQESFRPALRHRRPRLGPADDAADGLHLPARPDVAADPGRDGPRTGL